MPGGKQDEVSRARLRAARFLAAGPAELRRAAQDGKLLLHSPRKGAAAFSREAIERLVRDGLVRRAGGRIGLSPEGAAFLKRLDGGEEGFGSQHRELAQIRIVTEAGAQTATANLAESPLGQLARRKAKDGRPFLAEREWQAGERLRADYDRGRIMPRLGANWDAAVASGRRDGGAAELTDAALAARQRVEKALRAVGPELSGVLVDICCFLKGFETVEAERGWPVRSGKVLLKTALGALARHYDPGTERVRPGEAILHWGAENYRPSLTGAKGR